VAGPLVAAENVCAALEYVARGEALLGIVYRTDARGECRVRLVEVFPENTHPPITHPMALTARASPLARRYAAFLEGGRGRSSRVPAS
jgi:molybdate transport system substrate-binding protein